jgi:hypothetical protein
MIKYSEFLKESDDKENMIDNIIKQCKAIGNEALLYRGVTEKTSYNTFGQSQSRVDRKPRDTDRKLHELIDDEFQKQLGIRVRSSSTFVSKNRIIANNYRGDNGSVYIIIPISAIYVYSEKIDDLTAFVDTPAKQVLVKLNINTELDMPERSLMTNLILASLDSNPLSFGPQYQVVADRQEEYKKLAKEVLYKIVDSYSKQSSLKHLKNNEIMLIGSFYYLQGDMFRRATNYLDLAELIKEKRENL